MTIRKFLLMIAIAALLTGLFSVTASAKTLQVYDNGSDPQVYAGGVYDLKVLASGGEGRVTYTWQLRGYKKWFTIANHFGEGGAWDDFYFADPPSMEHLQKHAMDHLCMDTKWLAGYGIDNGKTDWEALDFRAIAKDEAGNTGTSQIYHMYIYSEDALRFRVEQNNAFYFTETLPENTQITREAGNAVDFILRTNENSFPDWMTNSEVTVDRYFEVVDGTYSYTTKGDGGTHLSFLRQKPGSAKVTLHADLYCGETLIQGLSKEYQVTFTEKPEPEPEPVLKAIDEADIKVTVPKERKRVSYPFVGYTSPYTCSIQYSPETGSYFEANMIYTATATLTAKEGYCFTDQTHFTVNGASCRVVSQDDSEAVLEYTFPKTSGGFVLRNPKNRLTILEDLEAAGAITESEPEELLNPFVDVFETDEYYDSVLWAYYAQPQITTGTDATHFSPKNTVKRCESVTFLWRAMGCPEPKNTANPFTDVKESDYFYKPVLWAVENNITKGTTATTFAPNDTLSTAHMITFLYRTKNPGKDGWYEEAAAWAGTGYDGKPFGVNTAVDNSTNCPRGYVVMFLKRAE